MSLVFLDTETTGLSPDRHEVWEVAFAVDDGPIQSAIVHHSLRNADPKALRLNGYYERTLDFDNARAIRVEENLREALEGATLVGANPRFDAAFLEARWGVAPWKYRLLDVEAYAMPFFSWSEPRGLKDVAEGLRRWGFAIPHPDHSAAKDVEVARAVFRALQEAYA